MKISLFISILSVILFISSSGFAGDNSTKPENVTPELRKHAVETLHNALANEQHWVKVRSAEYLLALDYPQGVREPFEAKLVAFGDEPGYRIGIWLVLAKATYDTKAREVWIDKILGAFRDTDGSDSDYAAEALSKLGCQIAEDEQRVRNT